MQLMLIRDMSNLYFIRRIKKVQGQKLLLKDMTGDEKQDESGHIFHDDELIFFHCVLCCISTLNLVQYFIFRSKRVSSIQHIVGWSACCLIGFCTSECIAKLSLNLSFS